jgi:hypothetical protein
LTLFFVVTCVVAYLSLDSSYITIIVFAGAICIAISLVVTIYVLVVDESEEYVDELEGFSVGDENDMEDEILSNDHNDVAASLGLNDEFASDYELMLEEEEQDDDDDEDFQDLLRTTESHAQSEEKLTASGRASSKGKQAIPPVHTWPNRPILVRRSPNMLPASIDEASREGRLLLEPIKVHSKDYSEIILESDLFVGKIVLIFHDIADGPCEYFWYLKSLIMFF